MSERTWYEIAHNGLEALRAFIDYENLPIYHQLEVDKLLQDVANGIDFFSMSVFDEYSEGVKTEIVKLRRQIIMQTARLRYLERMAEKTKKESVMKEAKNVGARVDRLLKELQEVTQIDLVQLANKNP